MGVGPVAPNSSSAQPDAANRPHCEVTDFHGSVCRL